MKKLLLLLAALFAISAGGICCSGSGDDPGEQEKPVDPPPSPDDGVDWSKIDPKATVRGVVTCASAAVQGVVVTDGVNMTRTNKQGAYGLRTSSDKSKLVYLTVPSGYEVESTRGFIPRFYRRVTAPTSVEQVQQHDFTLKKVNNDRHIMIVSADMHIRNRAMIKTTSSATPSICPPKGELDSTTFRRTYLKALRDYVKALPAGVPVYGMNLGDMTQESHWTNANKATLANFVNVCERGGMPIQTFHAIGNHDHDKEVSDDDTSAHLYRHFFGPTYYAFNAGKDYYIVLDNILYKGNKKYEVGLNDQQLNWVKSYLQYVPKGAHLFVCMHAPAYFYNENYKLGRVAELLDLFEGYKVDILSGHTHVQCNTQIRNNIREYNIASIGGAWWLWDGIYSKDGTPIGYQVFESGKNGIANYFKSLGHDRDYQFRYYPVGTVPGHEDELCVKVWNWDNRWKVEYYEDGKLKGEMKQYKGMDPDYDFFLQRKAVTEGKDMKERGRQANKNAYFFFSTKPSDKAKKIKIVVTDANGKSYEQSLEH